MERSYIAIDLKSFYASVECREMGLDPLDALLVVADESRTDKTICLAVSPALKAYGLPGRCRLFEVKEKIRSVNLIREKAAPGRRLKGASKSRKELKANPSLSLDFITAKPRMSHYIKCSSEIYRIYLKYIAPEDIHVYSIDEVFIDATEYMKLYGLSAKELAMKLILEVLEKTGITATAGIGENLYLAKIAMDIMAKHIAADKNGVRIAELDEMSYREKLWEHRPLTDFWRVGHGYAEKLEAHRLYTMGDIARCSERNEELLYRLFGVNAELLIDHAWGWEPCTMEDIKSYKPSSNSIGSGQVLQCPYTFDKARTVVMEMADSLALDLVERRLATTQLVLAVGYDKENMDNDYQGEIKTDHYGRKVPKGAHGSYNFSTPTSSSKEIIKGALSIFKDKVNPALFIRRIYITASDVIDERACDYLQMDLFETPDEEQQKKQKEEKEKERRLQDATISIKKKYGKNALLKGISFTEGATGKERNRQIGGHNA